MHPSLRVCSSRAHQPLIKFLGKHAFPSSRSQWTLHLRSIDSSQTGHTQPHAHPAAPVEVKEGGSVRQTPSPNSGSNPVFSNFWEAPERFWRKEIEDAEIEAILVSIGLLYRLFVG